MRKHLDFPSEKKNVERRQGNEVEEGQGGAEGGLNGGKMYTINFQFL